MPACIEALAQGEAWIQFAAEVGFPVDYDGTATPAVHRATETAEE